MLPDNKTFGVLPGAFLTFVQSLQPAGRNYLQTLLPGLPLQLPEAHSPFSLQLWPTG